MSYTGKICFSTGINSEGTAKTALMRNHIQLMKLWLCRLGYTLK